MTTTLKRIESIINLAWPRNDQLTGLLANEFVPIAGTVPQKNRTLGPERARYQNDVPILAEIDYRQQLDMERRALCLASSMVNAIDHDLQGLSAEQRRSSLDKLWSTFNDVDANTFGLEWTANQWTIVSRYIEVQYNSMKQ